MPSSSFHKKIVLVKRLLGLTLIGFAFAGCDQGNIKEPPPSQRPPLGVTKIAPLQSKTGAPSGN